MEVIEQPNGNTLVGRSDIKVCVNPNGLINNMPTVCKFFQLESNQFRNNISFKDLLHDIIETIPNNKAFYNFIYECNNAYYNRKLKKEMNEFKTRFIYEQEDNENIGEMERVIDSLSKQLLALKDVVAVKNNEIVARDTEINAYKSQALELFRKLNAIFEKIDSTEYRNNIEQNPISDITSLFSEISNLKNVINTDFNNFHVRFPKFNNVNSELLKLVNKILDFAQNRISIAGNILQKRIIEFNDKLEKLQKEKNQEADKFNAEIKKLNVQHNEDVQRLSEYKNNINQISEAIKQLKANRDNAIKQLKDLISARRDENNELSKQLSDKVKEYNTTIKNLMQEKNDLIAKLNEDAQSLNQKDEQINKLQGEIDEMSNELVDMKKRNSITVKDLTDNITELTQNIDELSYENNEMSNELVDMRKRNSITVNDLVKHIREITKNIKKLSYENAKMSNELVDMRKSNYETVKDLMTHIDELSYENKMSNGIIALLREKSKRIEISHNQILAQNNNIHKNNDNMQKLYTDLLEQLQKDYDLLVSKRNLDDDEINELKKQLEEYKNVANEICEFIDKLNNNYENLQKDMNELYKITSTNDFSQLSEYIRNQNNTNNKHMQTIQELQEEIQTLKQDLHKAKANVKASNEINNQLNKQMNLLNKEIKQKDEESKQKDIDYFAEHNLAFDRLNKIQGLTANNEYLIKKINELNERIENLTYANEHSAIYYNDETRKYKAELDKEYKDKLEAEKKKLQKEKDNLMNQLRQLEQTNNQEKIEMEKKHRNEILTLNGELNEIKDELNATKGKSFSDKETIESLNKSIKELHSKTGKLEEEVKFYSVDNNKKQILINALDGELLSRKYNMHELKEKLNTLEQEKINSNAELERVRNQLQDITTQLQNVTNELNSANAKNIELEQSVSKKVEKIDSLHKTINRLKYDLKYWRQRHNNAEALDSMENESIVKKQGIYINKLNDTIKKLEQEIDDMNNNKINNGAMNLQLRLATEFKNKMQAKKDKLKELKDELKKLKDELKNKKDEYDNLFNMYKRYTEKSLINTQSLEEEIYDSKEKIEELKEKLSDSEQSLEAEKIKLREQISKNQQYKKIIDEMGIKQQKIDSLNNQLKVINAEKDTEINKLKSEKTKLENEIRKNNNIIDKIKKGTTDRDNQIDALENLISRIIDRALEQIDGLVPLFENKQTTAYQWHIQNIISSPNGDDGMNYYNINFNDKDKLSKVLAVGSENMNKKMEYMVNTMKKIYANIYSILYGNNYKQSSENHILSLIDGIKDKINDLTEQNEQLTIDNNNLAKRNAELNNKYDELSKKNNQINEELNKLINEKANIANDLQTKNEELKQLRQHTKDNNATVDKYYNKIIELSASIRKLQMELQVKDKQINKLNMDNKESENNLNDYIRKYHESDNKNKELLDNLRNDNNNLAKCNAELEKQNAKLNNYKNEYNNLNNKYNNVSNEFNELKEENELLKVELQKLKQENEKLIKENDGIRSSIKTSEDNINKYIAAIANKINELVNALNDRDIDNINKICNEIFNNNGNSFDINNMQQLNGSINALVTFFKNQLINYNSFVSNYDPLRILLGPNKFGVFQLPCLCMLSKNEDFVKKLIERRIMACSGAFCNAYNIENIYKASVFDYTNMKQGTYKIDNEDYPNTNTIKQIIDTSLYDKITRHTYATIQNYDFYKILYIIEGALSMNSHYINSENKKSKHHIFEICKLNTETYTDINLYIMFYDGLDRTLYDSLCDAHYIHEHLFDEMHPTSIIYRYTIFRNFDINQFNIDIKIKIYTDFLALISYSKYVNEIANIIDTSEARKFAKECDYAIDKYLMNILTYIDDNYNIPSYLMLNNDVSDTDSEFSDSNDEDENDDSSYTLFKYPISNDDKVEEETQNEDKHVSEPANNSTKSLTFDEVPSLDMSSYSEKDEAPKKNYEDANEVTPLDKIQPLDMSSDDYEGFDGMQGGKLQISFIYTFMLFVTLISVLIAILVITSRKRRQKALNKTNEKYFIDSGRTHRIVLSRI